MMLSQSTRLFRPMGAGLWLLAFVLLSPVSWAESTGGAPASLSDITSTTEQAEVPPAHSDNICFGGFENRKLIVHEVHLSNPFKETTRLGCQVEGGQPTTVPDLPTPTLKLHRLA